jgi:hypothetical protein
MINESDKKLDETEDREDDGWEGGEISDDPNDWQGTVSTQADFEREKKAMADWLERDNKRQGI